MLLLLRRMWRDGCIVWWFMTALQMHGAQHQDSVLHKKHLAKWFAAVSRAACQDTHRRSLY